MDFLDPAKKRAHTIKLFVGYGLVAVAIAFATYILAFASYGYGVDRKTGNVIQNGLVFISAQPVSADIYLNNKIQSNKTDARMVLQAGQYVLTLKAQGYRTWQRSFTLEGGRVERFVYPWLFPEKLVDSDQQLYTSQPTFASASPDRHWMLVLQPGSLTKFDEFDLTDKTKSATILEIPANILTAAKDKTKEQLVVSEWSTDNRHLLLEHVYDDTHEYVMFDRDTPGNTFNVSKAINKTVSKITLFNKKYDQYYLYNSTDLTLQTANNKGVITPLLNHVLNYKTYGDNIVLYASDITGNPNKVRVNLWDNGTSYALHDLPAGTLYLLDVARFDNSWYMALGSNTEGKVYVYKNPEDIVKRNDNTPLVPVIVLKVDKPSAISFSTNTRFVMVENTDKFAVYDIETDRSYRYELKVPVDPAAHAVWMDGHRMDVPSNGKTVVFDYDGTNIQTLSSTSPLYNAFFDRDYTGLYNIAPSVTVPGRFALTRTELKVK